MVDAFNQRNCCPIAISDFDFDLYIEGLPPKRLMLLIYIYNNVRRFGGNPSTYGYLRVSSSSLETDILYFTFNIFFHYVLVLNLADDGFAFV